MTDSNSFSITNGANPPASGASPSSVNSQNEGSTGSDPGVNLTGSTVNSGNGISRTDAGKRVKVDPGAVHDYLTEVYEGVPGLLNIWTVPGKGSGRFFQTTPEGIAQAVDWIEYQWTISAQQGIYSRITTVDRVPEDKNSRGNASSSASFIGLWTDLDFGTTGHKGGKLPPDPATAQDIYSQSGLPEASIVVNSGGGLYHLVLLETPLDITDTELRLRVGQLARRWQQKVKVAAEKLGYDYGTGVSDLARVLRIPGTVNAKDWEHQRLAVRRSTGLRYTLEELERACPEPPKPKRPTGGGLGSVVAQAGDVTTRMHRLADELRGITFERNNALNRLSFMAFQYAGAGQLDPDEVKNVFADAARHVGLDEKEIRDTLHSACEAGMKEPYTFTVRMRTVQDAEQYDMWAGQTDASGQFVGSGSSVPPPRETPVSEQIDTAEDENGPNTYSSPEAPMRVARELEPSWMQGSSRTLHHWRDQWMRWTGTHWTEEGASALRSRLYLKLEHATFFTPNPKTKELEEKNWNPSQKKISNLVDAIAAVTHLNQAIDPGDWLGPHKGGPRLISCANTMINPLTGETRPHTPAYFVQSSVPYAYDPEAACPQWLAFLELVFPGDTQAQQLLQEWMGYVISGWTHYQKGMQLLGPPRAGKGTIARIIEKLIGKENSVGTTLKTLVTNFGMHPLIDKSLCVVGDAHMENRNASEIVSRILSITGEDSLTVDRKNRAHWTGKIPARIMILANKAPRFTDSSGAITGRFMTLHFTQSFAGREDKELENKLTTELAGILNWALEGLRRLDERGHFVQPESAEGIIETQREESSPHQTFVEDKCVTGSNEHWIVKDQLFYGWNNWCQLRNIKFPGTSASFASELYAAVPGIRQGRKRINGKLERVYYGITFQLAPGLQCPKEHSDPRTVQQEE